MADEALIKPLQRWSSDRRRPHHGSRQRCRAHRMAGQRRNLRRDGRALRIGAKPVADAEAFGAEMQKAGAAHFSEVRITEALDTEATAANLNALVERMAAGISPRDTFLLYAAAHGYSVDGRYYMIPQDYQGGNKPGGTQAATPLARSTYTGLDRQPHQGKEGSSSCSIPVELGALVRRLQ